MQAFPKLPPVEIWFFALFVIFSQVHLHLLLMRHKHYHLFIVLLGVMSLCANGIAQQLAFPSAEGYGKYTIGGRGGIVCEVTNLNDDGPGSLRAAIEAKGPRTIVFRVSGTIELQRPLTIRHPYVTIAGQTAPGDGICIKRHPLNIGADEVIIRYIRVRLGDESGNDTDAISGRGHKNIILDHVSASWSIDETLSIYQCENVTIQWCMITESLFASNHVKGTHGFGGIWGNNYSTYHHNLIAHHSSRNPRFASGAGYNDYRNNVVYNWGYNSCYGGEKWVKGTESGHFDINMVGNYYKPGPGTQQGETRYRIANPSIRGEEDYGNWYIEGNYVEGYPEVSTNNWNGGVQASQELLAKVRRHEPWPAMSISEESPAEAYEKVLAHVGASIPARDAVDKRIVDEVRNGYATYEGKTYKEKKKQVDPTKRSGIIDTPADVGGWPVLHSLPAPADTDHDGMPDEWEVTENLDPNNPEDRNGTDAEGWTNLERYINSIAGHQLH